MRFLPIPLGPAFGLIAVLCFVPLYLVAVAMDPDYVFFENYLSDLGVGPGAWAFNAGLMLAGASMTLFAYLGLRKAIPKDPFALAGVVLLVLSGILLFNIGVFTEDYGDLHTAISYSFFLVLLAAIGVLAVAFHRTKTLGRVGVTASSVSFAIGAMLVATGGNPFTETMAVLVALAWGSIISSSLLFSLRGG
jgi:hypothetical membrane protein